MDGAGGAGKVERDEVGDRVRGALYAEPRFQRHGFSGQGTERGLPVSERLDTGEFARGPDARDGVDLRRRV